MDTTLSASNQPPYKNQRGWLIAFGVVEILIACAFLLMLLFSAIMFFGPLASRIASGPFSPAAMMAFTGLQYALMAAVFLTGGIGSIRCKNWARILMLVVSGFWLGIGLLTTLIMAFAVPTILKQQPGNVPPGIQHAVLVVVITFMAVLMVLLPAVFLFFYSRKSVKATCLPQAGAQPAGGPPAPELPIPLAILGVWQALGALYMFAALFMRATFVFGFVLHGAAASLFLLTFSVLNGCAAWAILRQRLIGWNIALFMAGFGTINLVVTYLRRPDLLQLFREVGYSERTLRIYEQFPQFLAIFWVAMIIGVTAFLVFLLYTRKFFPGLERT